MTRKEMMERLNDGWYKDLWNNGGLAEDMFHGEGPRNLISEVFEISQCDNLSSRDFVSTFADLGVTVETITTENLLDALEVEIEYLHNKIQRLEAWIKEMEPIAPWTLGEDKRDLFWSYRKLESISHWEKNIRETLDENLRPKEEKVPEHVPFHWMQAKEFWDRILDFVVKEGNRLNEAQVERLYKKVCLAKQTRSINSWHYFVLAYWCARKLNLGGTKKQLLAYAVECKKHATEDKPWPPRKEEEKERRPYFQSLDKPIAFDEGGDPWKIEDIIPDHSFSEDELVNAIDARAKAKRLARERRRSA